MEHLREAAGEQPAKADDPDHDKVELDSVTLARLVAEVRNQTTFEAATYNRQHNRHNR
jgi:hypothetical protein